MTRNTTSHATLISIRSLPPRPRRCGSRGLGALLLGLAACSSSTAGPDGSTRADAGPPPPVVQRSALPKTGTIVGQVLEEETGKPVAGALVEAGGEKVQTLSSGAYRLTVPVGLVQLTVSGAAGRLGYSITLPLTGTDEFAFHVRLAKAGAAQTIKASVRTALQVGAARVEFPPGAYAQDTTTTLTWLELAQAGSVPAQVQFADAEGNGYRMLGYLQVDAPSEPAQAVTLTVPIPTGLDAKHVALFSLDDRGEWADPVTASALESGQATLPTNKVRKVLVAQKNPLPAAVVLGSTGRGASGTPRVGQLLSTGARLSAPEDGSLLVQDPGGGVVALGAGTKDVTVAFLPESTGTGGADGGNRQASGAVPEEPGYSPWRCRLQRWACAPGTQNHCRVVGRFRGLRYVCSINLYEIRTRTAVMGVRGTVPELEEETCADGSSIVRAAVSEGIADLAVKGLDAPIEMKAGDRVTVCVGCKDPRATACPGAPARDAGPRLDAPAPGQDSRVADGRRDDGPRGDARMADALRTDARPVDAAPARDLRPAADAASPPVPIGTPCTGTGNECGATGTCLLYAANEGVCSAACILDDPGTHFTNEDTCPDLSRTTCATIPLGGGKQGNLCLRKCRPRIGANDCVAPLRCDPKAANYTVGSAQAFCLGRRCTSNQECPVTNGKRCTTTAGGCGAGERCLSFMPGATAGACVEDGVCDATSGLCAPHTKGSALAKVGDPCTSDRECGNQMNCLMEVDPKAALGLKDHGAVCTPGSSECCGTCLGNGTCDGRCFVYYRNGYCAIDNCLVATSLTQFACPAGSTCTRLAPGGQCRKTCSLSQANDCRGRPTSDRHGDYECRDYSRITTPANVPAADAPTCEAGVLLRCSGVYALLNSGCDQVGSPSNPTAMACRDPRDPNPSTNLIGNPASASGLCLDSTASSTVAP